VTHAASAFEIKSKAVSKTEQIIGESYWTSIHVTYSPDNSLMGIVYTTDTTNFVRYHVEICKMNYTKSRIYASKKFLLKQISGDASNINCPNIAFTFDNKFMIVDTGTLYDLETNHAFYFVMDPNFKHENLKDMFFVNDYNIIYNCVDNILIYHSLMGWSELKLTGSFKVTTSALTVIKPPVKQDNIVIMGSNSECSQIIIHNLNTRETIWENYYPKLIGMKYSSNGKLLLALTTNMEFYLFKNNGTDLEISYQVSLPISADNISINGVCLSPCGRFIVYINECQIVIFDMMNSKIICSQTEPNSLWENEVYLSCSPFIYGENIEPIVTYLKNHGHVIA